MAITSPPYTLETFLQLPEQKPALEFADGEITGKVSPTFPHAAFQDALVEALNRAGRPEKIARAFPELRVTFAGASYVPDVVVCRRERIPVDADGRMVGDLLAPPDVAIEIVSPGQSVNALVRRCLWYVENGVGVALLVDPADESVLLFRPGAQPLVLHGPNVIALPEAVPGFALSVRELFASLIP